MAIANSSFVKYEIPLPTTVFGKPLFYLSMWQRGVIFRSSNYKTEYH